jgi:hypothetical protein
MLIKQYVHRLPADYDMQRIRQRVAARGPDWDATAGLGLKAFVARERGRHGATNNAYASVYLWLEDAQATAFITSDRFGAVINTFGRPSIETWLPLDVQTGSASAARSLRRETIDIPEGTDLAAFRAEEIARNAATAGQVDTLAVFAGIDLATWRLTRFTLSADVPSAEDYEVLYLATPGRQELASCL